MILDTYKNLSEKFLFKDRDFKRQFAHIYAYRLREMTALLSAKAADKWGKDVPLLKLSDLNEDAPVKCVIIGTLYKHQDHKPSILREISEENQLLPQSPRSNYASEGDKLILEDELQRIRLFGKFDVQLVVTGVVCAVLGRDSYIEGDGKFLAEDYLLYESGPQKPLNELGSAQLVVLISDLSLISAENYISSLELLQQWLCGNLKKHELGEEWSAANVIRVIVAGNSVQSTTTESNDILFQTSTSDTTETLDTVKKLDEIFSTWSESVNVDLMPGECDPTNYMLPQQPFHHCMFPSSFKLSSFQSVPNPYNCEVADRMILGTSGQNVNDIVKTSKIEDPLEALRLTIRWSHIAPTSPDTLPCYPYVDFDPFIIRECPHIYFAGNCSKFQTDVHKGSDGQVTRLVCVPSFSKTQSIALVNLKTLEANSLSFSSDLF